VRSSDVFGIRQLRVAQQLPPRKLDHFNRQDQIMQKQWLYGMAGVLAGYAVLRFTIFKTALDAFLKGWSIPAGLVRRELRRH